MEQKHIDESRPGTEQRLGLFRRRLLMPLVTMGSAAVAAYVVGKHFAPRRFTGGELGAMSAFVFAWAGLGRLGYEGLSYDGETAVERSSTSTP